MSRVVFVLFLAPIMSTTFGYGADVPNIPPLTLSEMFPVVTRPIPIANNGDLDTNKFVSRFSKAAVVLGVVAMTCAVGIYYVCDCLHEVPQHTLLLNVTLNDSLVRNASASPKPFATAIPTPAITPGIPPLPSAPGTVSAVTFTALPPVATTASAAPTTNAQSQNCKDYADYLDRNAVAARYLRPISCTVQNLSLDNLNIGPEQMAAIAPALRYLENLETLSFNNNPLQDSGVITLASVLGMLRRLTTLSLSNTNITDVGADALKSAWQAMIAAKQHVPQVCSLEGNFITTGKRLELKKIFLNIDFGW